MGLWDQAILNDVEEKSRRLPFRLRLPLGLERGHGQLQDINFVCAIPWAVSGAHLPSRRARASGRHFALNIENEDRLFPELVDPQRRSGGAPTSHMGCVGATDAVSCDAAQCAGGPGSNLFRSCLFLLDFRADCTGRQERHVRVSPSSLDSTASTQPVPLGTRHNHTPVGLCLAAAQSVVAAQVVQGVRLDVCAERGTAGKVPPVSCFGVRDDGAVAQGAVPSLASLVAIA